MSEGKRERRRCYQTIQVTSSSKHEICCIVHQTESTSSKFIYFFFFFRLHSDKHTQTLHTERELEILKYERNTNLYLINNFSSILHFGTLFQLHNAKIAILPYFSTKNKDVSLLHILFISNDQREAMKKAKNNWLKRKASVPAIFKAENINNYANGI